MPLAFAQSSSPSLAVLDPLSLGVDWLLGGIQPTFGISFDGVCLSRGGNFFHRCLFTLFFTCFV
jgi:hypothetical protein